MLATTASPPEVGYSPLGPDLGVAASSSTVFTHSDAPGAPGEAFPVYLLALTAGAGIVDATSYLAFSHTFAATMTGNLIFVGLAGIGAPGFVLVALVGALISFFLGAFVAGRWIHRRSANRVQLLRGFTSAQLVPTALAALLSFLLGTPLPYWGMMPLLALLAFSMGIQAAGAARMRVPGLERTTVLTTTFANLGADAFATPESYAVSARWLLSIVALVGGAVVGGALFLRESLWVPLAVASALVALVVLGAFLIREPSV
jgi:uncharacterized membrane protein YoaK (UPF0700 family)